MYENHLRNNDTDRKLRNREGLRARGITPARTTWSGRKATEFSEDRIEEEFEYDLSEMGYFDMRVIDRHDPGLIEAAAAARRNMPAGTTFGVLPF